MPLNLYVASRLLYSNPYKQSCLEIVKLILYWVTKHCVVSAMWDYIMVKIKINMACTNCSKCLLQGQAKNIGFALKNNGLDFESVWGSQAILPAEVYTSVPN